MTTFIQEHGDGSITKNSDGTYNFVVDNKVVSTHKSVAELVKSRQEPEKTTTTSNTKASPPKKTKK